MKEATLRRTSESANYISATSIKFYSKFIKQEWKFFVFAYTVRADVSSFIRYKSLLSEIISVSLY
jgi:hypothetical protein